MTSGSMLITNYLGEKTLLQIADGKALAGPPENALTDARAQLKREERNATVSEGNVVFLKEWIRVFTTIEVPGNKSTGGLSGSRQLIPPLRLIPHYTKVTVLPRYA